MAPGGPLVFFDTHCHLQDSRFGNSLDALLLRAQEAGVTQMVCCGTREADWDAVTNLAQHHGEILPMLGLHPWYSQDAQPGWLERLSGRLQDSTIGCGECGLDFTVETPAQDLQESVFRAQVRLACALNRPLSIHCRRAWERLAAIAREEGLPAAGAVIHAFSGSAEIAREMQKRGFHLAFGCSLRNSKNRRAAKAIMAVAEDRLLFETDAPDLPPQMGTLNEPANLRLAAVAVAELRGADFKTLANQVYENSQRIFGALTRGDGLPARNIDSNPRPTDN